MIDGKSVRLFALAIIVPLIAVASDSDRIGSRSWPRSLHEFWAPLETWRGVDAESDYALVAFSNYAQHCRYFAEHNQPEAVIPDMIADLQARPSDLHFRTYGQVMQEWPRERVLAVLRAFEYSFESPVLRQLIPFYTTSGDSGTPQIAHRFTMLLSDEQEGKWRTREDSNFKPSDP